MTPPPGAAQAVGGVTAPSARAAPTQHRELSTRTVHPNRSPHA